MNALYLHGIIIQGFITIRQTLIAILGWLLGFPLRIFIKRNPGLTVVISRPESGFADNSKYFFIYANNVIRERERVIMLTTDRTAKALISASGCESVLHPSWRSLFLLLRCSKVVTDNMDWYYFGAYQLTRGAKLIQLWHGAPLKHIELDKYRKRLNDMPALFRPLLKIQKAIIGRYPVYDIFISTSQWFTDKTFKSSFKSKHFVATGYPRNDILFGWPSQESTAYMLAWINVDKQAFQKVTSLKNHGYYTCLYAPTFRKNLYNPFETSINLGRLSEFAKKINLLIILKLHPFMHDKYRISEYPNLLEYPPLCDVYPLMTITDILITDYSSIYFDFLLLDRPILFYPYDLDQYINHDRDMYFDYEAMTPGAKCHTYNELESAIERIIINGCRDEYSEFRHKIRSYTYDHFDDKAHERLINHIKCID
jgi:CDP-glycerol glycerophosphotransferase